MALLDEADAVADRLASLALEALTPAELLAVLARREVLARRQPAIDHRLLNRLVAEAVPTELGGTTLAKALAHRLKISQADARRRLDEAADLGPGSTLAGAPLPPKLPCAAAAQAQGLIGGDHVRTIRWFFATLPDHVDLGTRIDAERELARLAAQFGPEHFRKAAERMMTTPRPAWTVSPAATRSAVIPAGSRSASTMPCWPPGVRCWPAVRSANSTGCPSP